MTNRVLPLHRRGFPGPWSPGPCDSLGSLRLVVAFGSLRFFRKITLRYVATSTSPSLSHSPFSRPLLVISRRLERVFSVPPLISLISGTTSRMLRSFEYDVYHAAGWLRFRRRPTTHNPKTHTTTTTSHHHRPPTTAERVTTVLITALIPTDPF
jgi:hypothetical protein